MSQPNHTNHLGELKNPLRVLLVEDSEEDALLLQKHLDRAGVRSFFLRVETLSALATALDGQAWDIVICDHSLPAFDSLGALRVFRQRKLDIPFIIVSGVIGEDVAVQAMKAGASDYVMKNLLGRLVPAIRRELREAESRREKRGSEEAVVSGHFGAGFILGICPCCNAKLCGEPSGETPPSPENQDAPARPAVKNTGFHSTDNNRKNER